MDTSSRNFPLEKPVWRKLRSALRLGGRRTLATLIPPNYLAREVILVSGLPRSGTSWIAKAISLAPRVAYYFESDSELPESYRYRYLPPNQQEDLLHHHIASALSGRIRTEYVLAEQSLTDMVNAPLARTILHKWVKLPLTLHWVEQHFPDIRIVQTVRHPVPLFLSWKQRNWDPGWALGKLLEQDALIDGPLSEIEPILRSANTELQKATGFWAAVATMQLASRRPRDVLREHEWYCLDPVPRIRWLFEQLNLTFRPEVEDFLSPDRERASGPGYGHRRDPRSEVRKWCASITDDETREIRNFLDRFELPFYPGLAPDVFPLIDQEEPA